MKSIEDKYQLISEAIKPKQRLIIHLYRTDNQFGLVQLKELQKIPNAVIKEHILTPETKELFKKKGLTVLPTIVIYRYRRAFIRHEGVITAQALMVKIRRDQKDIS